MAPVGVFETREDVSERTLRAHLRAATREQHDRLDGMFSGHDPARATDLAEILAMHAAALPAIEGALARWDGAGGPNPWIAGPLTRAVAVDLAALGRPLPAPLTLGLLPPDAALGLAYVLTGSRLGVRQLHRRWQAAAGARARSAGAFLGWTGDARLWPGFVRRLDAWGRAHRDWSGVTAGACAAFGLFAEAADQRTRRAA